jgi:hypothetical protein
MGLFDEIKCNFPLPDLTNEEAWVQDATFQSKSLDPSMDTYTITKEGRLLLHRVTWDIISPEERENKNDKFPILKSVPGGDIDMEYHGDIFFYFGPYEFKVRFTEGQVVWVKRININYDADQGNSTS